MSETSSDRQIQEYAAEVFEMSKTVWAAQSHTRGRQQAEITETEFLALDALQKAGRSLTVGDIQKQIGVLPAQMSRIIRSLENKSEQPLIRCRINPSDKRRVDVELAASGRRAHQSYRDMKLGTLEKILSGLSREDLGEFMRILRQIRSIVIKSFTDSSL